MSMNQTPLLWRLLIASSALLVTLSGDCLAEAPTSKKSIEFFESRIRPILVERCYECHSSKSEEIQGGLRLDTRELTQKGGESGPAVVPGGVEKSLLIEAIRYESFEMPPDSKLSERVIADFEKWIKMGAPDPRDTTAGDATETETQPGIDFVKARQFWSFQPPQLSRTAAIGGSEWVSQPIDAFVLTRLNENHLKPNAAADKRTLIRRVTFDLTGLPPTPSEIDSFLNDSSDSAYERVVERLLNSPHYGERWGRMWLDVARYAEDQAHIVGNNSSLFYPNAYLYRDWVIDALNNDMPYDRFVLLQLAADLVEPNDDSQQVALGFLGLGPKYYRRSAPEVMADEWEDRVDTVARGLLGLTVACARCHDHKYDPIPTEDYYGLAGVFAGTEMFNRPIDSDRETDKGGQAKKPADAIHVVREGKPTDLKVFIRGDITRQGEVATRHFPQILSPDQQRLLNNGSGRLDLARAIIDPGNPLTARVIVNRVWAQNFGKPLVGTPSNFGNLGQPPTHPELLDDLAVRFMQSGWSLKWLQREIVLSSTYRQSSSIEQEKQAIDPDNQLLWRMNRRRLDVERWRDAVLAVTGCLSPEIGGPSIDPESISETRRTIYSRISRLDLNPMLALFDFPDPNAHSARRSETTTPLQKLFVLNSPFMVHYAGVFSHKLLNDVGSDAEARLRYAYQLLYGREATDREIDLSLVFLREGQNDSQSKWQQLAQVLLASNEMLFID